MDLRYTDSLMDLFCDFGEAMLTAGAEIGRVESSLDYLCRAYGAVRTDVFVITSSIVLTVLFDGGVERTQTRRIISSGDTDYEKLRRLNALCRCCCTEPMPIDELREKLDAIAGSKPHRIKLYAGSALAAGAFSVFFGGGLAEAVFAALFGLLVCLFQIYLAPKAPNKVFFLFLASLIVGLGIGAVHRIVPVFQSDMVIIGDIMLLVPGIAITEAVRDMLIGDTISGSTKLFESLLRAAALAAGFMISILIFGR